MRACAAGANCSGNVLGGRLEMGNGQNLSGLRRYSELTVDQQPDGGKNDCVDSLPSPQCRATSLARRHSAASRSTPIIAIQCRFRPIQ
jgi:hypothetical protein